eukprot:TRINITY_DN32428_c0_g1_i2.p1 TRINITY_DN32428_c0_g1~~TRINITY_DN32428_c0_g1_i2.p1  ORF type:complete len:227 (+),score=61.92 TRINITY_DN32428_c0_g1_i2:66-746(+)
MLAEACMPCPGRSSHGRRRSIQYCVLLACLASWVVQLIGGASGAPFVAVPSRGRSTSQLRAAEAGTDEPPPAVTFKSAEKKRKGKKGKKRLVNPKEEREKAEKAAAEAAAAAAAAAASETEEDREFRERYMSAGGDEEIPEWQRRMREAKTKEERFKVGWQVGDIRTSLSIIFTEWFECLVSGDKERLDKFLADVGISPVVLTVVQVVVVVVPWTLIALALGWLKL